MAEIINPGLREIARRIVGTPGFTSDHQGLRRALGQYAAAVTPQQRIAFEQALLVQFFADVHAEFLRDLDREMRRARSVETAHAPAVAALAEDETPPGDGVSGKAESLASVSVLKFRSESADYSPATQSEGQAARPRSAPDRETPRTPGPVTITTLPNRPAPRTPLAVDPVWQQEDPIPKQPVPVQQRSTKVDSYRRWPELTSTVALADGVKEIGKFSPTDTEERGGQIGKLVQVRRTANVGDEERVKVRDKLNARDRLAVAGRRQEILALEAERDRMSAAKRAMIELGCATIDELPEDALAECGFQRYAA